MTTVIFDIEATCEDRKINPNYPMETIEIGAVKIEGKNIIDRFSTFIKPELVTELTPYCTNLTTITYNDLKDAPPFREGILAFYKFIYGSEILSCGDFDKKFLSNEISVKCPNSKPHQLARNAILTTHKNLKVHFNKVTNHKMVDMVEMAEVLGIPLDGTHHRADSDAENLAKIYLKLEELREQELRKHFNDKTIKRLLKVIRDCQNVEIIEKEGRFFDEYPGSLSFLEFLDFWSQTIIDDHEIHNFDYLEKNKIKVLKRLKK